MRPRFGVMRGREFLMKDAYSFDLDREGAQASYRRMFVAYLRTFARMGLKAIPMRAATGPIGGNLSHEFVVLAETGESQVFLHRDLLDFDVLGAAPDYDGDLSPVVDFWTGRYAATDEEHDEAAWAAIPEERRVSARGIEVGHIFYFGTKYSASMDLKLPGPDGAPRGAGDGQLRHRRLAPGRRPDRGQPRRGRHTLARSRRALRRRGAEPEAGRRAPATRCASGCTPPSRRTASTTTAPSAPASNSPTPT